MLGYVCSLRTKLELNSWTKAMSYRSYFLFYFTSNFLAWINCELISIISINEENITRVCQTKFLGFIQSNPKWNAHITSITNKTSKAIGVTYKARHALDTQHLKMLYQSLIEPYLNYCCMVWANPVKNTALESLFKIQKRSVRIICFAGCRYHTLPLFKQLLNNSQS